MAASTATTATTARSATTSIIAWDKTQQQLKPINKKNSPLLSIAVVAVVVLAAMGMWRLTHAHASTKSMQIMTVRKDIPAGTRLGQTTIVFQSIPKQYALADMITSYSDVNGSIARTYIPAGEPILKNMVFAGRESLANCLEIHERAVTLQLQDDSLVDHFIMPDDRVDLLASVLSKGDNKKYTRTICQDIRVLFCASKDQVMARGMNTSVNKITLAVTPHQAEIIKEAEEIGKIKLVLRNPLSGQEKAPAGADPSDILADNSASSQNMPTPPLAVPPPPPSSPLASSLSSKPAELAQWVVEVVMGNKKETYAVPEK